MSTATAYRIVANVRFVLLYELPIVGLKAPRLSPLSSGSHSSCLMVFLIKHGTVMCRNLACRLGEGGKRTNSVQRGKRMLPELHWEKQVEKQTKRREMFSCFRFYISWVVAKALPADCLCVLDSVLHRLSSDNRCMSCKVVLYKMIKCT